VVFAARPLLERIKRDGMTPIILSSTIEHRVREEAEALGVASYFGRHIYGSPADPRQFSKKAVFERLMKEDGITGENLLSFGDGPVEIISTKELGGLAIAVCSDENHNGSGVMDAFKRKQLLDAGADAAIPDFRDANALLDVLLKK
jgi:FMN phosphatase YigB (HAD superfamily)